jgi:hypothetical protein
LRTLVGHLIPKTGRGILRGFQVDSPFKHPFAFTSRNADNILRQLDKKRPLYPHCGRHAIRVLQSFFASFA